MPFSANGNGDPRGNGLFHLMLLTENGELFECGKAGDDDDSVLRQNISLEPRRLQSEVSTASMMCTQAAVVFRDGRLVALDRYIENPHLCYGVKEVACGNDFTVILTEGHGIYTWGAGKHGQLGHGDRKDISSPKVRSLTLKLLIDI